MSKEETIDCRKLEKRIKLKSKKREKTEDSDVVMHEVEDTDSNKGIEHSQISDKDENIESKKRKRKDTEIKKCKNAGLDDVDLEKNDSNKGELIGLHGEDNTEYSFTYVERKKGAKKEKSKKKNRASDHGLQKVEDMGEEREIEHYEKDKIVERKQKKKKIDKKVKGVEDVDLEKFIEADVPITNIKIKKKKKDKLMNRNGSDNNANGKDNIGDATNIVECEEEKKKVKNTDGDINKENGKDSIQSDANGIGNAISNLVQRKMKKDVTNNKNEAGDNANGEDSIYNTEKKKRNNKYDVGIAEEVEVQESADEESVSDTKNKKKSKKKQNMVENQNDAAEKVEKRKKKRLEKQNDGENKKVRFSSEVEVFNLPSQNASTENNEEKDKMYRWNNKGDNLIRGKRFSKEEDEIIKAAVLQYIKLHSLGEDGLDMVLNPRKHKGLRGCWKEIGSALPYRPFISVYHRGQLLFRRADKRRWTQEEIELIHNHQKSHGNTWTDLAEVMGTFGVHVSNAWRRTRLPNFKTGKWSQQEYQKLFDLVNTNLQLKVAKCEEKKTKYGMLRDNIAWTSISYQVETRSQPSCHYKWYRQLTSPMVSRGVWADSDDYRMIGKLYGLDASSIEDVDWDELIDGRSGELCRKRWNQMSLHIGRNGLKEFAEQVELLTRRYCPHLLETREEWDNKPRVP